MSKINILTNSSMSYNVFYYVSVCVCVRGIFGSIYWMCCVLFFVWPFARTLFNSVFNYAYSDGKFIVMALFSVFLLCVDWSIVSNGIHLLCFVSSGQLFIQWIASNSILSGINISFCVNYYSFFLVFSPFVYCYGGAVIVLFNKIPV